MEFRVHHRVRHQCGVALILALSVLAILTILVMALAFVSGSAQRLERVEQERMWKDNLARAGFDLACAILAKLPVPLADTKVYDLKLEEGSCRISAALAEKTNGIYGGNFVRPRPGDVVVRIEVNPKGTVGRARVYHYLVNTNPAHPRRLLYDIGRVGVLSGRS